MKTDKQYEEALDVLKAELAVLRGVKCEAGGDGPCGVVERDRLALTNATAESRRLSIRLEAAEGLLRERSGTYRTCEGNWVFEGDSIYVRTGETRLLGRVFDQHRCDAGDPEKCWEHRRRRFLAASPESAAPTAGIPTQGKL